MASIANFRRFKSIHIAWCPYNRHDRCDRYSSKRIQRSERLYGNRSLSDRSIAMIAIAEIENVLSQRSLRSLRSLSARFAYNRSDRGVFLSYRSDPSDYMDTRLIRKPMISGPDCKKFSEDERICKSLRKILMCFVILKLLYTTGPLAI